MTILELKRQATEALNKAEAMVAAAETAGRGMTDAETESYNNSMAEHNSLCATVDARVKLNTVRTSFAGGNGAVVETHPERISGHAEDAAAKWQTRDYRKAFIEFAHSQGRIRPEALMLGADDLGGFKFPALPNMNRKALAAAYEGSATDGSAMVQLLTQETVVPLAPPEMGIESLATVIPTTQNLKFPRKTAHGTGAAKAEGTGSGANLFTGTDPTQDSFELSAYMIGHPEDASWELLQDVKVFQSFMTDDILLSLAILKENWYWSGTGTNQAQGLKGNIGAGVSATQVVTAGSGDSNGSALIDSTFDVLGALNAVYHPRASFLMSRATSVYIRKAQKQANLFEPVFVRSGGADYLHGYPVTYSTSVDSVAAVNNVPVVFGDFKAGYLIGVRGGAGINIKILDQPKALEGLLTILGYQRIDGRVRRSEALQPITIAS